MSTKFQTKINRRRFVQVAAAASVGPLIVPGHVLGGPGYLAPSDTFGGALIRCRSGCPDYQLAMATYSAMALPTRKLAECDLGFLDRDLVNNQTFYSDFRRVMDRKDIDVVAVATPRHWLALIIIAAAQSGKDIFCAHPFTHSIGEGRAVVNAVNRYGRVCQVGTFGRFGVSRDSSKILTHKIMKSGLLRNNCQGVHIVRDWFKVRAWSGRADLPTAPVPPNLDWDMYCGPAPLKPYVPQRYGATHRGYWDYAGGGLGDMGQHHLDPVNWIYAKDDTSPVEIEAFAPPADLEVTGMWGWVELKYADGFTLVLESTEWGRRYDRKAARPVSIDDLNAANQATVRAMPDEERMLTFAEAVRTRRQTGGHPEAAHRTATIMHLANIAIRVGRKIRFDPVREQIVGDEEANRLVMPPMRAPWHL